MRLVRCPDKCVAKLRHGEAKRSPRHLAPQGGFYGYYLGCPSCGMPQIVTPYDAAMVEEATGVGAAIVLSVPLVTCGRCACRYRVDRDELTILWASHAR